MVTHILPETEDPVFLPLANVKQSLNISLSKAYSLVQSGVLPSHRFGVTYRVTQRDLDEFILKSRVQV